MALGDHLRELRRRFILGSLGLVAGAIVGWILYPPVYEAIQEPIERLQDEGFNAQLNFSGVATSFDLKMRVSLTVGLVLSSPWWLYHFWAFITPGLTKKERRYALGFVGAAVPLFTGGVAMAWIALPNTVRLLTQFTPMGTTAVNFITAAEYVKFVLQFVLIFGFAFLLPLVMVALNFMGLVRGMSWLKGWRWAVLVIFLIAALATPTADAVTFILMAVPIVILYFLAVGLSFLNDRRRDKRKAAAEKAEETDPTGSDVSTT